MIVSQFDVENFNDEPDRLYRVHITNLGSKTHLFRLTWRTRPGYETPFEEHWYTSRRNNPYDVSPVVALEPHGKWTYIDKNLLELPPNLTVSVTLSSHTRTAIQRVYGYLDLTLPVVFDATWTKLVPQSDQPVPVLLHASSVSQQSLHPYESGARLPTAIPLSTGQALNEIVPDQPINLGPIVNLIAQIGRPPEVPAEEETVEASAEARRDYAAMLEDPRSVSALVAYLGMASQSREGVAAVNTLLKRSGHPVRLQRDTKRTTR